MRSKNYSLYEKQKEELKIQGNFTQLMKKIFKKAACREIISKLRSRMI